MRVKHPWPSTNDYSGLKSTYKAGIDVLATLLQQAVQLDDGDVVVLNPGGQPAQSLVREGERGAMVLLTVPQNTR